MNKTLKLSYFEDLYYRNKPKYSLNLKNDENIQLYYMNIISDVELKLNYINCIEDSDVNFNEFDYYCNPFLKNEDKLKEFIEHNPILRKKVEFYFGFSGDRPNNQVYLEICYDFTEKVREYSISCEKFYNGKKKYLNSILRNNRFFRYLGFKLCLNLEDFSYCEQIELIFGCGKKLKFDLFDSYPKIKNNYIEYIVPIYENIQELLHAIKYVDVYDIQKYINEINNYHNSSSIIKTIESSKKLKNNYITSVVVNGKKITKTNNIRILILGLS